MAELLPPNSGTACDSNPRTPEASDGCECCCPHAGDPPIANQVETRPLGSDTAASGCGCHPIESEPDRSDPHDSSPASTGDHNHAGSDRGCSHDDEAGCGCSCSESPRHCNHDEHGCGCSHSESSGCDGGCDHSEAGCGCSEGCDDDEECGCEGCDGTCDCDSTVDTSWLEEHAPTVDTPTPEEIIELVAACIKFVKDALGFELDLTAETLPILDHYLLAARETLTDRHDLRELVWRCAGAYFGELVRRRYNGFWSLPNADAHTWRINQRQVLLSFNPVGVASEAIFAADQGEGPTGALRLAHADQEDVSARLAQMPPLPADEYYLLSTRLEVIDTVIEHLRLRMEQNDQAEVNFDPDDYVNDLAPYGRA